MAQYKIHDPDEMIQCPLNKAHVLQAKRMQYHIMDCRKNFRRSELATCPLNARHVMLKKNYREHMDSCPDRAVVEAMMSNKSGKQSSTFRGGYLGLPIYEQVIIPNGENWEDEYLSVPKIGVDSQPLAKQDHMITPGPTQTEKKDCARQMHIPAENRRYTAHQAENNEPSKVPLPQQCPPKTIAPTNGSQSMRSTQRSSAVFACSVSMAGIGRGRGRSQSEKLLSPPPAVPKVNNGIGKENGITEDSIEDFDKNLKKIEKKLRQIELLETKVDEGHTLTAEEVKITMAQYKVLDPEQEIPCPYNRCEMIRAKRMPYHLIKCRRAKFASCPLNAIHVVPKPELRYHIENCPDKPRIEQDLSYEIQKEKGSTGTLFQGCVDLPEYHQITVNSEDDWEKEVPILPRIGVDPNYFAKIEGIHIDGYVKYPDKPSVTQQQEAKKEDVEEELRIPNKISQTYISNPKPAKQQPSAVFAFSLSSVGVGRGQIASVGEQQNPQSVGRGRALVGRGIAGLRIEDGSEGLGSSISPAGRGQIGKECHAKGIAGKLFSSGIGRGSH
uniref:Gametocyte-specific factor 1 n=1 Tax=Magallana gigas TaxID=29159 RepID=K1S3X9_MAGGI